tara:strand:+ start:1404 stop:1820 length:417 start_codon:yes stop_codon:yes gene_type:complete
MNDFLINEDSDDGFEVNILPMIDVIFAILTFFVISSLYLTRVETIQLDLPSAKTSSIQQDIPIIISIDRNNNIYLDKINLELSQIIEEIYKRISLNQKASIIIAADIKASYGTLVEILDQLRTIDNIKIGLSTDSPRY